MAPALRDLSAGSTAELDPMRYDSPVSTDRQPSTSCCARDLHAIPSAAASNAAACASVFLDQSTNCHAKPRHRDSLEEEQGRRNAHGTCVNQSAAPLDPSSVSSEPVSSARIPESDQLKFPLEGSLEPLDPDLVSSEPVSSEPVDSVPASSLRPPQAERNQLESPLERLPDPSSDYRSIAGTGSHDQSPFRDLPRCHQQSPPSPRQSSPRARQRCPRHRGVPPPVSGFWRLIAGATIGVAAFVLFRGRGRTRLRCGTDFPDVIERAPPPQIRAWGERPRVQEYVSIGDRLLEAVVPWAVDGYQDYEYGSEISGGYGSDVTLED
ncbi:hypothetical protein CLOM_g15799 [Closterium sp. NIES-68]|nr:hypothetical protein CLOM_g15799 [Closterium sp. NIES-68]GJP78750.1 hypothetical protein CLOP_g9025 [Closterium sp. NIES-67]